MRISLPLFNIHVALHESTYIPYSCTCLQLCMATVVMNIIVGGLVAAATEVGVSGKGDIAMQWNS